MRNSITIYEPVKEGYTFAGWMITYNNQAETGDSAPRFLKNVRREPVGAIALKATWASKQKEILFQYLLFCIYLSTTRFGDCQIADRHSYDITYFSMVNVKLQSLPNLTH